jgi:hypothetical protein
MPDFTFQSRVATWLRAAFGEGTTSTSPEERSHRFIEEALELVQANGCTATDAHMLVDYVFGRPVGELHQEVGGVMVTLAALCHTIKADMGDCAELELARCWANITKIRAKQATKPKIGPLPGSV